MTLSGGIRMYENLKALRESLNMTQKEFAASIGMKLTTYSGYETGVREPKSDFWIAVAQKYNVTIDYLMGYSDNPHKTGDAKTPPNPDAPDQEEPEKKTISVDALEHMMIEFGLIKPGEDLSDPDLKFLLAVGQIVEAWFRKGEEGSRE